MSVMKNEKNEDHLIGNKLLSKYTIIKKLGQGSFGCIYKARKNNKLFALKIEKNWKKGHSLLQNESYIMSKLKCSKI